MTDEHLLYEFEDLLRTAPDAELITQHSNDTTSWLGRASAALHLWDDITAITSMDNHINALQVSHNRKDGSYRLLMMTIHRAKNELRMKTVGPLSEHIQEKKPFEYFNKIREIVEEATSEVFFVDPYLDAEFVSKYLPQIKPSVNVKLLTSESLSKLVPAVQAFVSQHETNIEIRKPQKIHDRFVFIDGSTCYQSGASFKDGAKNSPATISQITDLFPIVYEQYQKFWDAAEVIEL